MNALWRIKESRLTILLTAVRLWESRARLGLRRFS
jgi:hypothetical protein